MVEQIERARSIHSSEFRIRAMNEEDKKMKGKRRW